MALAARLQTFAFHSVIGILFSDIFARGSAKVKLWIFFLEEKVPYLFSIYVIYLFIYLFTFQSFFFFSYLFAAVAGHHMVSLLIHDRSYDNRRN